MEFIFPVAVYKDIEFKITDEFMLFYKDFCDFEYKRLEKEIELFIDSSYYPSYLSGLLNDYQIIRLFSKEDIESALAHNFSEAQLDTLRFVIQTYLERKNDFSSDSCEWEPEYEIVKGETR